MIESCSSLRCDWFQGVSKRLARIAVDFSPWRAPDTLARGKGPYLSNALARTIRAAVESWRHQRAVRSASESTLHLHLGQIDRCLPFVGGVVADPQGAVLPHQAGIAGVAAGRQLQELGQVPALWIDSAERSAGAAIVEADGGDESAVGQAEHVRAADTHPHVAPGPLPIRRHGRAQ